MRKGRLNAGPFRLRSAFAGRSLLDELHARRCEMCAGISDAAPMIVHAFLLFRRGTSRETFGVWRYRRLASEAGTSSHARRCETCAGNIRSGADDLQRIPARLARHIGETFDVRRYRRLSSDTHTQKHLPIGILHSECAA